MSDLLHEDARAREAALDTSRSFIVQAPAGSGKTELLTQRFLALLAAVERPESVLAITFTRKAAAEMRSRILQALRDISVPEREAKMLPRTVELARAVRESDRERGWGLFGNPSRLRLLTIDALNQGLARRLPVLSGTGAGLGVEVVAIVVGGSAGDVDGFLAGALVLFARARFLGIFQGFLGVDHGLLGVGARGGSAQQVVQRLLRADQVRLGQDQVLRQAGLLELSQLGVDRYLLALDHVDFVDDPARLPGQVDRLVGTYRAGGADEGGQIALISFHRLILCLPGRRGLVRGRRRCRRRKGRDPGCAQPAQAPQFPQIGLRRGLRGFGSCDRLPVHFHLRWFDAEARPLGRSLDALERQIADQAAEDEAGPFPFLTPGSKGRAKNIFCVAMRTLRESHPLLMRTGPNQRAAAWCLAGSLLDEFKQRWIATSIGTDVGISIRCGWPEIPQGCFHVRRLDLLERNQNLSRNVQNVCGMKWVSPDG